MWSAFRTSHIHLSTSSGKLKPRKRSRTAMWCCGHSVKYCHLGPGWQDKQKSGDAKENTENPTATAVPWKAQAVKPSVIERKGRQKWWYHTNYEPWNKRRQKVREVQLRVKQSRLSPASEASRIRGALFECGSPAHEHRTQAGLSPSIRTSSSHLLFCSSSSQNKYRLLTETKTWW